MKPGTVARTFTTSFPQWYKLIIDLDDGGVAQLAEQRTHKPRVTRSIRVTATKFILGPHTSRTSPE